MQSLLWLLSAFLVLLLTGNNASAEEGVGEWLRDMKVYSSSNGVLDVTLTVDQYYYNGPTVRFWTRAYNGGIPGPVLRVSPGDYVSLKLVNKLGSNSDKIVDHHGETMFVENTFHNPNSTNLHTHGLHVTSNGNSDNVLIEVPPQTNHTYEYNILSTHGGGTHWYHAHYHGSTAIQLGGGLAGALIVEEPNMPPELKNMTEVILVFNQFSFETPDTGLGYLDQRIIAEIAGDNLCTQVDILGAAPHNWLLVNGQYQPQIPIQPGEYKLFRIVQATINDVVELTISGCTMYLVARDGVWLSYPRLVTEVVLVSGTRVDIAVSCPNNANYKILAAPNYQNDQFLGASERYNRVIATIVSSGASKPMSPPSSLPPIPSYLTDLRSNSPSYQFSLNLQQFALHDHGGYLFPAFKMNKHLWRGENYPVRNIPINSIEQWTISNLPDFLISTLPIPAHPMHIHVNHVQVISYRTKNGKTTGYDNVLQVGEWRDTFPIPPEGNVVIRFKPHEFVCKAIFHCHIAGHEDMGMMGLFNIVQASQDWSRPPAECTWTDEATGRVYDFMPLFKEDDWVITDVITNTKMHLSVCGPVSVAGHQQGCGEGASVCATNAAGDTTTMAKYIPNFWKTDTGVAMRMTGGYTETGGSGESTIYFTCDQTVGRGTPQYIGYDNFHWYTSIVC